MVVKTYRGLLADGGQDRISLHTIKGKVGYKIVKFQLMPIQPGIGGPEAVVKIYSTSQATINGDVNFNDGTLLAVAYQKTHEDSSQPSSTMIVVFDAVVFNQDIYVTGIDVRGAISVNYYIELEVIPLTDQGAEYTTIKDIRSNS